MCHVFISELSVLVAINRLKPIVRVFFYIVFAPLAFDSQQDTNDHPRIESSFSLVEKASSNNLIAVLFTKYKVQSITWCNQTFTFSIEVSRREILFTSLVC